MGENRAQDLEAKHARYGDAFRWHFIGHLQSRKAKVVNATCELCHSLDSESAAQRLTIPALVEVNLSGEPTKSGVDAGGSAGLPGELCGRARADDHAAGDGRPRGVASVLPPPPRAGRGSTACAELSMGTSQDYAVAAEEGATLVRVGAVLLQG